jgi:hypothetical protein
VAREWEEEQLIQAVFAQGARGLLAVDRKVPAISFSYLSGRDSRFPSCINL